MPNVISIADDLTGAAESAAALTGMPPGSLALRRDAVVLSPATGPLPDRPVVVLDTDSRSLSPAAAAGATVGAVALAFAGLGDDDRGVVFKKVDSLLRGNTAGELRAIAARWPLVLAPALPVQGRTVAAGVLAAGGTRHDLAALLPEGRAAVVTLEEVRGSVPGLTRILRDILGSGRTPIVDAGTDADLDAVAAAVVGLRGAVLAGSGGLASALGRSRPAARDVTPLPAGPVRPEGHRGRIVTVVGTAEPAARRQLLALEDAGVTVHRLDAVALLQGAARRNGGPGHAPHAGGHADRGDVAYAIEGAVRDDEATRQRLASALAGLACTSHPAADFIATGGQTAKALLNALGQSVLFPAATVHPGAVLSVDPTGRVIATRPGSFGSPDSLVRIHSAVALLRALTTDGTTTRKALP